ncbi:MAG: EcsC family protein [Bacteroidota bacterium]
MFDIASMYGYDVKDYKERVYVLHIFELAFFQSFSQEGSLSEN